MTITSTYVDNANGEIATTLIDGDIKVWRVDCGSDYSVHVESVDGNIVYGVLYSGEEPTIYVKYLPWNGNIVSVYVLLTGLF